MNRILRNASRDDHEAIVALNLADEAQTSPMDLARLATLDQLSCYHRVACIDDEVLGFLLAIRAGAAYENENFSWFASRYAVNGTLASTAMFLPPGR